MEGLQRMMRMMMMKISNYVDLHKYMLGGGWKGQDLQGLLWWIIIEVVRVCLRMRRISLQNYDKRGFTSFKNNGEISSMGSKNYASGENVVLDGEVNNLVKEGKSRLEKLVEVPMYSPMEVRKVDRECKKDDEEKMRISFPFYRSIREGQGEVKGGGVNFGVVNSLLGEILGEVIGEME
ncbi:hypothetical protein Tco_1204292 [Tanacetum coccineum]